jgi:hypothetical protein
MAYPGSSLKQENEYSSLSPTRTPSGTSLDGNTLLLAGKYNIFNFICSDLHESTHME